jgi:hypothetical protein
MTGWVLRGLSGVRTQLGQRLDLLLEFIVLRHQLAVLQRAGTRRPCFRPSERLLWVFLVALVGKLAARSDHRPARHRFALAPSRLPGNLGIRLMSPLARRTPEDQSRGPRAYSPNEPGEFLMGRATDPWRAAETWIRCLASYSVPLNAARGLSAHPESTATAKMLRPKICGGSARVGCRPCRSSFHPVHISSDLQPAQALHEGRHRSPTERRYRQLSDGVWSMAKLQVRRICLKAPQIYVMSIE